MKRKNDETEVNRKFPDLSTMDACVSRYTRDQRPVHYSLKIESFSMLQEALEEYERERYESLPFVAGGYNWKLALYPNGDEKRNGSGHLSLYLVMADNDYQSTSEVYATFTFLVYDNLQDKHLAIQDGKIRRFHAMKKEWGFPKLLLLSTFNDASNGFLVDDYCVFGVDVFVMKCKENGEVFSFSKEPKDCTFTWKINVGSKLDKKFYESDTFTVEGYDWLIRMDKKPNEKDGCLCLYLLLVSDDISELAGSQVYIESEMVIMNQVAVAPSLDQKITCNGWLHFDNEDTRGWIGESLMASGDLMDPSKGFILDDSVVVTAKISVISTLKKLS